ncbi:MAG: RNA pseudouridine synthase [Acidobacteriota bacterium]
MVINKPAGLVCHPSKDGPRSSVIGRVRLYLGHDEGRLVNRLDRETSGVVLIARGAGVAGELGRLFSTGVVQKTYAAIVHGLVAPGPMTVVAPLGRDERSEVAIKDCVRSDGAHAETEISSQQTLAVGEEPFSLLEVRPRSGRKHQIRIHLAHIGHPIVGDKLYGLDEQFYLRLVRNELSDADRAALILRNHALHAERLVFSWRGETRAFDAPRGAEFSDFVAAGSRLAPDSEFSRAATSE